MRQLKYVNQMKSAEAITLQFPTASSSTEPNFSLVRLMLAGLSKAMYSLCPHRHLSHVGVYR